MKKFIQINDEAVITFGDNKFIYIFIILDIVNIDYSENHVLRKILSLKLLLMIVERVWKRSEDLIWRV